MEFNFDTGQLRLPSKGILLLRIIYFLLDAYGHKISSQGFYEKFDLAKSEKDTKPKIKCTIDTQESAVKLLFIKYIRINGLLVRSEELIYRLRD